MAKTEKKAAEQTKEQATERAFIIKQIFIKKNALDVKVPPFELNKEWKPDATLNLDVQSKAIENDHYNVDLLIDINVKIDKQDVFSIQVTQSGIFEMSGYTDDQIDQLKNSFCANILFPYARQLVSTTTSQAGFPPLIMAPVDFDGRYQELRSKQQAK